MIRDLYSISKKLEKYDGEQSGLDIIIIFNEFVYEWTSGRMRSGWRRKITI